MSGTRAVEREPGGWPAHARTMGGPAARAARAAAGPGSDEMTGKGEQW